jgi:hypothetical protein
MLEDVTSYSQSVEEYVEKWIVNKVVYDESKISTKVQSNGKVIKFYPVHPKGSPNREYLERRMKEDLIHLIEKYKNGVA